MTVVTVVAVVVVAVIVVIVVVVMGIAVVAVVVVGFVVVSVDVAQAGHALQVAGHLELTVGNLHNPSSCTLLHSYASSRMPQQNWSHGA